MEHRIAHACGHEQAHYIPGFATQQARKANWLRTTKCRVCFAADKRSAQAANAATDAAAIADLDLPALMGSERQVSWASTIRARRLAVLLSAEVGDSQSEQPCQLVTDAKWWIDHRDLDDTALLAQASLFRAAERTL
jgi:hypothetical protein